VRPKIRFVLGGQHLSNPFHLDPFDSWGRSYESVYAVIRVNIYAINFIIRLLRFPVWQTCAWFFDFDFTFCLEISVERKLD
jgi:hypothetical protein